MSRKIGTRALPLLFAVLLVGVMMVPAMATDANRD